MTHSLENPGPPSRAIPDTQDQREAALPRAWPLNWGPQGSPHTRTTCVKGVLSLQRQEPPSLATVWCSSLSAHPSSGSRVRVCTVSLPGGVASSGSGLPSLFPEFTHSILNAHIHSLTHRAPTTVLRLPWGVHQFNPTLTLPGVSAAHRS